MDINRLGEKMRKANFHLIGQHNFDVHHVVKDSSKRIRGNVSCGFFPISSPIGNFANQQEWWTITLLTQKMSALTEFLSTIEKENIFLDQKNIRPYFSDGEWKECSQITFLERKHFIIAMNLLEADGMRQIGA